MADTQMEKLKRRLGITDAEQDALLQDILDDARAHFKLITGAETIDTKYDFIILDVADIRYNRKGSTGMKSESVDGYSVTFADISKDFLPYMSLLNRDFELDRNMKGKVHFW